MKGFNLRKASRKKPQDSFLLYILCRNQTVIKSTWQWLKTRSEHAQCSNLELTEEVRARENIPGPETWNTSSYISPKMFSHHEARNKQRRWLSSNFLKSERLSKSIFLHSKNSKGCNIINKPHNQHQSNLRQYGKKFN